MEKDNEYCACDGEYCVTGDFDDFGNEWLICTHCGRQIEDSYKSNYEFEDY